MPDPVRVQRTPVTAQYSGLALSPQHAHVLRVRGIAPDVARERGYWSADYTPEHIERLVRLGFASYQIRPGLVIPLWNTEGKQNGAMLRPDEPRLAEDGDLIKYECPAEGPRPGIDVPPRVRPVLDDPDVDLWITESPLKADALASIGLRAIDVNGVWGWRLHGNLHPDFEKLALKKRAITLAFDSDTATNAQVWDGLTSLAEELHGYKCHLRYCNLPQPPEGYGKKWGVDDYLAFPHTPDDLLGLVKKSPPERRYELKEFDTLALAIRHVMLKVTKVDKFDRPRLAVGFVREAHASGRWVQHEDGHIYYYEPSTRRLHDAEGQAFANRLSYDTNLAASESLFKHIYKKILAEAGHTTPRSQVHTLAYYDLATGRLAVHDGGTGVWVRAPGGEWALRANGEDEVFFVTEEDADPWTPEFGENGELIKTYIERFTFADEGVLTVEDQRTLWLVYLLSLFFPALRRTLMIPAYLGPQGSCKTTALRLLGRLVTGPRFDSTSLSKDKEDAFVAAITHTSLLAIDNADSRVPWLDDMLATYATGTTYRLRRLYSTNDPVSYRPRAALSISSRDPHFRRPDVAERLLPFLCARPSMYCDEVQFWAEVDAMRGKLWGALLTRLGRLVDGLPRVTAPAMPFRMADFAAFGWRAASLEGEEKAEAWLGILGKLEIAQGRFAAEGDGTIATLRVYLAGRRDGIGPMTTGTLFERLADIARGRGYAFPKTAQGFGNALTAKQRVIETELSLRYSERRGHGRERIVTMRPKGWTPPEGWTEPDLDARDPNQDTKDTRDTANGLSIFPPSILFP